MHSHQDMQPWRELAIVAMNESDAVDPGGMKPQRATEDDLDEHD